MQELYSEQSIMPRSALRYRPIHENQQAQPARYRARRQRVYPDARTRTDDVVADDLHRQTDDYAPRALSPKPRSPRKVVRPARTSPWLWVLTGALLLVVLGLAFTRLSTWGTNELNTLRYGSPRTFQIDAVLGHHDSVTQPTHLIAINRNGEIDIIEFPGGDATKARTYVIKDLAGLASPQDPVTLQLFDPAHTGKPDLIITVGSTQNILINAQGGFRTPTPAELQQFLLSHP